MDHGTLWATLNMCQIKEKYNRIHIKEPALGFSVSVSETCFRNIAKQVLFPYVSVSVPCFCKDPSPSLIPSFLDSKKKKS